MARLQTKEYTIYVTFKGQNQKLSLDVFIAHIEYNDMSRNKMDLLQLGLVPIYPKLVVIASHILPDVGVQESDENDLREHVEDDEEEGEANAEQTEAKERRERQG